MQKIFDWLSTFPLWQATIILTIVVSLRAQATYWLGVLVNRGVINNQLSDKLKIGVKIIEKWGLPIIPLSFFTIGLQTIVQFSAGVLNINPIRYTLAAFPGYIAWAFIYATGGLSLFNSIVKGNLGYLIIFAIIILLALILNRLISKSN